jgi:hypothetical protein
MNKTKHTPGPWKLADDLTKDGTPIVRGGRHNEAVCYSPVNRRVGEKGPSDVEMANARLIAAAPELLDNLQHAVRFFDQLTKDDVDRYRAAISRATGES